MCLLHYDYVNSSKHSNQQTSRNTLRRRRQIQGKALWLLDYDNRFRIFVSKLVSHRAFEFAIVLFILISTLTLAVEGPMMDPDSEFARALQLIDLVMTIIFTLEAILKIIAFGFVIHRKSYLRKPSNQMDFVIVLAALFSLTFGESFKFLKALRILRILRPLRLISRIEGLKISIISLYQALPSIFQLQMIVMFFMYSFATVLTVFLSGKLYACDLEHTVLSREQKHGLIRTKWDCLNYGGSWINPDNNFDNVLSSIKAIFLIQTKEALI